MSLNFWGVGRGKFFKFTFTVRPRALTPLPPLLSPTGEGDGGGSLNQFDQCLGQQSPAAQGCAALCALVPRARTTMLA
jgi:hypothetical protein